MIQNLPSDIKPSIANKLNFRNLGIGDGAYEGSS